jgi:hypothetical protein
MFNKNISLTEYFKLRLQRKGCSKAQTSFRVDIGAEMGYLLYCTGRVHRLKDIKMGSV